MRNKVKIENIKSEFEIQLENFNFFKLDCDLEEYDKKEAYILGFLGTLAGFSAIDILSNPQLIKYTREGMQAGFLKLKKNEDFSGIFPLLIISEKISNFNSFEKLLEKKKMSYGEYDFDILEFHIDSNDNDLINKIFLCAKNELPNKSISINLSRKFFSNANIVELIKNASTFFKNNLLIEVDGLSKKDNKNNEYNKTIQTISTADIINKELKFNEIKFRKIPIILSGGINPKTIKLAFQCGVNANGISINVKDLQLIKNYKIEFLNDDEKLKSLLGIINAYSLKIDN